MLYPLCGINMVLVHASAHAKHMYNQKLPTFALPIFMEQNPLFQCRYITNEKFYLTPVKSAQATKPEILEIDRVNYEFNLIGKTLPLGTCNNVPYCRCGSWSIWC